MLRYVPALLSLALTVYCVIDAFQTPEADMRSLPKMAWIIVVLLFPIVGPASWLIAGRPRKGTRGITQQRRPRGPDDDPDFLKDL